MYIPRHFEEKEQARTFQLIRDYPFATLIGVHKGLPVISHLPILLKDENTPTPHLIGHMARKNPHASQAEGSTATVIFHGPHTYITPKWYAKNDVPTWNYAAVHITGKLQWITEAKPLIAILRQSAELFEKGNQDPWPFFIPEDLRKPEDLTGVIVGFDISIEEVQSKFKLSQNRSQEDQMGVINGLQTRTGDEMSGKIGSLMNSLRISS